MGQLLSGLSQGRPAELTRLSSTKTSTNVWLIAGLGNPGSTCAGTRHNVGFDLIDRLAQEEGIHVTKHSENALTGRGRIGDVPVLLAKPQTYMNRSGTSVSALARYHKIPKDRILIVADDLDTPLGALRLRTKGSHGGHNGLRSVQACMGGAADIPRLRLGVGRPTDGTEIVDWVLQKFRRSELETVDAMLQEGADAVRALVSLGLDKAVSGCRVDARGKRYTRQAASKKRKGEPWPETARPGPNHPGAAAECA